MSADPPFVDEIAAEPPKPNGPDHGIELLSFRDLLTPNLTTKGLVKGIIDAETLVLMFGAPGCGKTFLGVDLALSIAAGREWFGHKTKRGRVVYVAAEAGKSIRNRVSVWAGARWNELDELDFHAVVSPVSLCDIKMGDVNKLIKAIGTADVVIIDTVSRAMAGGDENSPVDMGGFVSTLDRLRARLGCCIIAIHHIGKDASRGPRGWSGLHAAVDTEIGVVQDEGVSIATVMKQRDGPGGERIAFKLRQVELGTDQDGDPVTSCVVDSTDYVPEKLSPSLAAALKVLKSVVGEKGVGGKIAVDEWRQAMAVSGKFGEGKSNGFRAAWKRAQDKLAEDNYIAFGEGSFGR